MSDNFPVLHSANNLTISFPQKNPHISVGEAEKTRSLVQKKGKYSSGGEVYIEKNALAHLFATDSKGANRFYNDLDTEDKLENTQGRFASAASVNKEISKRIQEPRDTLTRERLRDSEACINAFRDAPELEKIREVGESKNRREQPMLKAKKIQAESLTTCQLTGEPLEPDAEAHHIERKADKPRKTLDPSNIAVINKSAHQKVHSAGAESPDELKALCKKKGWNVPS